eukprot:12329547-Alexandrium_andersonii.AAC.2
MSSMLKAHPWKMPLPAEKGSPDLDVPANSLVYAKASPDDPAGAPERSSQSKSDWASDPVEALLPVKQ